MTNKYRLKELTKEKFDKLRKFENYKYNKPSFYRDYCAHSVRIKWHGWFGHFKEFKDYLISFGLEEEKHFIQMESSSFRGPYVVIIMYIEK